MPPVQWHPEAIPLQDKFLIVLLTGVAILPSCYLAWLLWRQDAGPAMAPLVLLAHGAVMLVLLVLVARRQRGPLKRLQQALIGAEAHFMDWFVASRIVEFSPEFDIMLGFSPGEIPRTVDGLRWLYHPEDALILESAHRRAFLGETDRVDHELRIQRKGGSWHWIHIRVSVVSRNSVGRAERMVGIVFDATRQHQAEEALRQLRSEEEEIFTASPVALMILRERIIQRANDATTRLFGYSQKQLIGASSRLLFETENDYDATGRQVYVAMTANERVTYEGRYRHSSGRMMWLQAQCARLDPRNPQRGIVFSFTDITARIQARAERDAAVERQNALFSAIPDGLAVVRDGIVVDCNEKLARLCGHEIQDIVGQHFHLLYRTESDAPINNDVTNRQTGGELRQADGSLLPVTVRSCLLDQARRDMGEVFILTPMTEVLRTSQGQ